MKSSLTFALGAGILLVLGCQGGEEVGTDETSAVQLASGMTADELSARVDQFAPIEIDFDDSLLDLEQRIVIEKLVQASGILHQIFRRQVWGENEAYRDLLAGAAGPEMEAAREYFDIMVGPWDRLDHNQPFLDVPAKPQGAGYYDEDITREEIEAWLETHPEDEDAFTSYWTVIRRDGEALVATPYSEAYAERLAVAAGFLREAADHAANPSLKEFLLERAESFETNDYYGSEVAWMQLEENLIEPTIGPYEVYEDELMGWKAAFESFITVKDPQASADLDQLKGYLRDLEAALPMDDVYKDLDRSFESPISVVDEVYTAGDANAGVQTIAYNLPNDPRVSDEYGSKKVMLRNVITAKFETILVPIAEKVMAPSLMDGISGEAFFTNTVMHELAHGLGPRTVHGTETTVSVALQANYSAIEECKADVVGVLSLAELADRGVYPADFKREVYVTGVSSLFRCVRFGTGEAHGKGCAIQLHALLDSGAVSVGEDGRFTIDFDRIHSAYEDLGRTLLTIEATGDVEAAETLLTERGENPPQVAAALATLTDVPVDIRPQFTVLERMETW